MGFLDKALRGAKKAKRVAEQNADKIDGGIDKAAKVIDEKTGRKHTAKIDKVARSGHGLVEKLDKKKGGGATGGASGPPRKPTP